MTVDNSNYVNSKFNQWQLTIQTMSVRSSINDITIVQSSYSKLHFVTEQFNKIRGACDHEGQGGQVQTGGHFRTQPGLGSICQFRHQYITSQRYRPCKPWDLSIYTLRAYIIVWADFLTSPSTCSWKDQERHFNFFLGANFFKFFNATEKLKKNSTLYVVIWRYS